MRAAPQMPYAPTQLPGRAVTRVCPDPKSVRAAPRRALLAGAAMVVGALLVAALHVLPASRGLDPLTEPLSQYAFASNGWLFDAAILSWALGLVVLVTALAGGRRDPGRVLAAGLLGTAAAGLVGVVVFPDHDPAGAVGTAGRLHWVATMLAFACVTCAPALLGRHAEPSCCRLTSTARRLAAGTGPYFLLLLAGSLLRYETSLPVPAWWLGLGERTLVALELAIAAAVTMWVRHGCYCDRLGRRAGLDA